ncbi:MAG: CDP-diacylglycerol--glycerol-3-phosphate 3-phosphatidyltransferase [Candidatus Omnitrophica bacterium]|nr:CDP-diacylglycerol--glycerol-3-phosphate 3-phosphatidyltransferase [Candidatus Omnitrophota bacterium]
MTLPNFLTLSRIALAFLLWPLLFWDFLWAKPLALAVFIAASLTDYFDGRIARTQKQISSFGAIMDPIADKVLVLTTFTGFARMGILPVWLVLVILAREVTVTLLRLWVIRKGVVMPAQREGKQKTVSQIVTALYVLIFLSVRSVSDRYFPFWGPGLDSFFLASSFFLGLLAAAFTLISGIACLVDFKRALKRTHS